MSTKLQEYQARLNESTERLWKDSNEYIFHFDIPDKFCSEHHQGSTSTASKTKF